MSKPAINRDQLSRDVSDAATILIAVSTLASLALHDHDSDDYLLVAIEALTDTAHDRLDVALRSLGGPT